MGVGSIETMSRDIIRKYKGTNMMQVLVLGATGRLGQMLQWHLPKTYSFDLRWQTRTMAHGPLLRSDTWVIDDPLKPTSYLQSACQSADVIINLLGATPGPDRDMDLNTALALAPYTMGATGPVMVCSSAAVYGKIEGPCCEDGPTNPLSPYGIAKLQMEKAVHAQDPKALILRIGNIAGADQLLGGLRPDVTPVLHQFANGATPKRAYISPQGLGAVFAALTKTPKAWPDILNVAAPAPVEMGDLLKAAGRDWTPAPAPADLPPVVDFDTTRLGQLIDRSGLATTAPDLVAEWQTWLKDTGGRQ